MGETLRFALLVVAVIAFACVAARADSIPADHPLAGPVDAALARYALHGGIALPALDGDERRALYAGEPVVRTSAGTRDGQVDTFGVVGLHIVDAPRLLVWLTAMGVASEPDVRLTRAMLTEPTRGTYLRYQHVDLPWPLRDRHWVIHCEKNAGVARSSNGEFWEHRWQLVESGEAMLPAALDDGRISGLSPSRLDRSVYLPANRGAWATAAIGPGRTLVIAAFDGSLGGLFPDAMVRRFARVHLRAGLNLVAELSLRAHLEYADGRTIYDGFGEPISRRAATEAARQIAASTQVAMTE